MKKIQLGKISRYIRGITFKPIDVVEPSSPDVIVCMRTKNVQQDLDQSDLIAVSPKFVKRDEQYLHEGDLLVSSANSWNLVGKTCYVPKLSYKATAGGFISIVRPNRKQVEPRYLYHWLSSGRTQHYARLCGRQTTNISNLDRHRFLELKLPLPSLDEQRRIAAILDKADAVRRKRKKAIALTEDLLRSAFLEMFGDPVTNPKGWRDVNLKNLCSMIVDCPHTTPKYTDGGRYPCIRTSDLQDGYITLTATKHIAEDQYQDRIKRHIPVAGDVMYSREGERFGIAARVPPEIQACLGQRMMLFQADYSKATSSFLWALLNSSGVYHQAVQSVGGSTSPHVNVKDIKNFKVYLPPLATQLDFERIVHRSDVIREKNTQGITASENLFNSLLQRAFRGDL